MRISKRFMSLFSKQSESKAKICVKRETLLDSFREKCINNSHKIEKIIDFCDSKSLLHLLNFSHDARINEIPFYNKISKRFKELQDLVEAEKLCSAINEDNHMLKNKLENISISEIYEILYTNRFMLSEASKIYLSKLFIDLTDDYDRIKNNEELVKLKSTLKKKNLFENCKSRDIRESSTKQLNINLPAGYSIDFDFQGKLVMIKNEKENKLMIIHKTTNFVEMDVTFGKKLIDVFHPDALFLEIPPITHLIDEQEIKNQTAEDSISLDDLELFMKAPPQASNINAKTSPRLMSNPINLIGGRFSKLITSLVGDDLKNYCQENMMNNSYVLKENEDTVYFNSGNEILQVPLDFPTYLYYYNKKYRSDRPVVFCDFTEDELACNFIQNTSEEKRHLIKSYLKWMSLLSTTSWIYQINNIGCTMCSKFIDKSNVKLWPTPLLTLINDNIRNKTPTDPSLREQLMAYSIYKESQAPQYKKKFPEEKTNLLMICRNLSYLNISKHICEFISNKEKVEEFEKNFIEKYRNKTPSLSIWNDSQINDESYRRKLIKKWSLHYTLCEQPIHHEPYFKYAQNEKILIDAYKVKSLQLQTLSEQFTSINDYPILSSKEDFENISIDQIGLHQNPIDDQQWAENKFMRDYYSNDGGIFKCQPVKYLQGMLNSSRARENAIRDIASSRSRLTKGFDTKILDIESDNEA